MPRKRRGVVVLVGTSCAGKTTLLSRRELGSVRVVDTDAVYMRLHRENRHTPSKAIMGMLFDAVVEEVMSGEFPVVLDTIDYAYAEALPDARVALLYAPLEKLAEHARQRRDRRPLAGVLETFTDLFTCNPDRATGAALDLLDREAIPAFLAQCHRKMSRAAIAAATERACRRLGLGDEPQPLFPAVAHDLLIDDGALATQAEELASFVK